MEISQASITARKDSSPLKEGILYLLVLIGERHGMLAVHLIAVRPTDSGSVVMGRLKQISMERRR